MNYLLINASPRGCESNSRVLCSHFQKGLEKLETKDALNVEILDLRSNLKNQGWKAFITKAHKIIIVFPLYTDHVPGILKQWIEDLGPEALQNKGLGWLAQCGFPDSIHLDWVAKYCLRVTELLGASFLGVIKKPGIEMIRMLPDKMTAQLFMAVEKLALGLGKTGKLDSIDNPDFQDPPIFSPFMLFVVGILNAIGLSNIYWNKNLKDNKAYAKRFDKPYEPGACE